jgi:hypothetical protein
MNVIDIWRSILVGQSFFVFVWLIIIYLLRLRQKPQPGLIIGITVFSIGDMAAILYVVILTLIRFGQPADYKTWLATVAILGESFGCVFIALHLFFHDDKLMKTVKIWFHVDSGPPQL